LTTEAARSSVNHFIGFIAFASVGIDGKQSSD